MNVSVIVPVYNEEKFIKKCLESLTNQQEKADEIIVIDNNCRDKTIDIAKKFPVRIVRETVQGMIAARNRGFNEAKHEIIARVDADVIVPPDWIKTIKQDFFQEKIDALTGPLIFYDLVFPSPIYSEIYFSFMRLIQLGKDALVGPNMIITKKIWQKIKSDVCLNDKLVHEDIDLGIHINKSGGRIKYNKDLAVKASGRRIAKNPLSFFIEYPIRAVKTLLNH
jgi:glycosyltransferase involved in cell wall biosynthesis